MITFKRDGTKVVADVETGDLEEPVMRFHWETGRALFAGVLAQRLRDRIAAKIQEARRESYEEGYKDGRAKRGKADYHRAAL